MPAGFRCHVVGKCSLLWYRLNTLCWSVNDHGDIVLDHFIQFYLNNLRNKSSPINSTHYVMLYPQNGDSFVTVFYDVTSPNVLIF